MPKYLWGIHSKAPAGEELLTIVRTNFGIPKYWGRYLSDTLNEARGLTREEISFLKKRNIRIIPIYNGFREATEYYNGIVVARNALYHAQRLGFPKDTVLFVTIEHQCNVDHSWIRAWVESISPSGFRPGILFDAKSGFIDAYCKAVEENKEIANQLILWSSEPDEGTIKERSSPRYNPVKPKCKANVWGWLYGRDNRISLIESNLIDQQLFQFLS